MALVVSPSGTPKRPGLRMYEAETLRQALSAVLEAAVEPGKDAAAASAGS